MPPLSPKRALTVIFAFIVGFISTTEGRTETVELLIKDKVIGKTTTYLGLYSLTDGPSEEITGKYIKDLGINTTKFWLRVMNFQELARRSELYGENTKQKAIRQVTKNPEKVDWDFELQIKTHPAIFNKPSTLDLEPKLEMCKKYGLQPVLEMVAPFADYRNYSDVPLVREVFWRYVFLFNYWVNKIKKYNFVLWNLGSENTAEANVMQADVGSDAIREAEKLTGVRVKVGAAGDDWNIQDIIDGFEGILQSDFAERLDVLSYHSFNFLSTFPKKSDYPTYLEQVRVFDELQRKYRPGKPILPYWDTGWFWRTRPGSGGHQSDLLFAGLHYISRIIWANQDGVELCMICGGYGIEDKSLYGDGAGVRGLIKIKEGSNYTRPARAYYAVRLVARATAGAKDRLEVEGLPAGNEVLALASRDKKHLYLTVINRTEETTYRLKPIWPAGLSGKPCTLREFSGKLNDEVVSAGGRLPLELQLEPLSTKQLIVEL
ncbi:MAG TPA: hypothetical protein VM123_11530 [archaeon]|nr:hypothetical protein [archaeon]